MTTKMQLGLLMACLSLGLLMGCVTGRSGRRGGLSETRVQTFPSEVQESYQLFAIRCSRCHTLSRPLNAAIYDYNHWASYVARMRRHSGSGISTQDAKDILIFLDYYVKDRAKTGVSAPRGGER